MIDLVLALENNPRVPPDVRDYIEQVVAALQQWQQSQFINNSSIKELLAICVHSPNNGSITYTAGASFADVSTANLYVTPTFTTTRALVRLSAYVEYNTAGGIYYWNIREGTRDLTGGLMSFDPINSTLSLTFVMTNLIPGKQVTWTWGHRSGPAGAKIRASNGGIGNDFPPAIMEVWSL